MDVGGWGIQLEGNGPVERAGRQCTEAVNGLRELRFNTFINKNGSRTIVGWDSGLSIGLQHPRRSI